MLNYDELVKVDMTRDVNLPVLNPVEKRIATEHRIRGKVPVLSHETQIEQTMPDSIPHAKSPKQYMSKEDIPAIDIDYSMEKEV